MKEIFLPDFGIFKPVTSFGSFDWHVQYFALPFRVVAVLLQFLLTTWSNYTRNITFISHFYLQLQVQHLQVVKSLSNLHRVSDPLQQPPMQCYSWRCVPTFPHRQNRCRRCWGDFDESSHSSGSSLHRRYLCPREPSRWRRGEKEGEGLGWRQSWNTSGESSNESHVVTSN